MELSALSFPVGAAIPMFNNYAADTIYFNLMISWNYIVDQNNLSRKVDQGLRQQF